MSPKIPCALLLLVSLGMTTAAFVATPYQAVFLVGAGFSATCAILTGLYTLRSCVWHIHTGLHTAIRTTTLDTISELHSMHVLLQRFPECSMPTTSYAIRFANLHSIIAVLDRLRPNLVVELGSGLSTLGIAAWMKQAGKGQLLSFDHDERWAAVTRAYLTRHQLDHIAEVIIAPLRPRQSMGYTVDWYDLESYLEQISPIDVLVVDGPPTGQAEKRLARLPALDVFRRYLAAHAVVVLDDASRSGEQAVLQAWLTAFPEFDSQVLGTLTGMVILETSSHSTSHHHCNTGHPTTSHGHIA